MTKLLSDRLRLLDHVNLGGKICAEIGVFDGRFSKEILARNPAKLVMVDPWKSQGKDIWPSDLSNVSQNEFDKLYENVKAEFGKMPNVEIRQGFSYFVSQDVPSSFDFVYIDAIHTFNSCFCDILTWYHKVVPGGWLCGHDFTGDFIGVKYAVEAFCQISEEELALVTTETWGSWGIQKGSRPLERRGKEILQRALDRVNKELREKSS